MHGAITLYIWRFPKIRGTILGFPIIGTIVFLGLYLGPLILGNCHIASVARISQFRGYQRVTSSYT